MKRSQGFTLIELLVVMAIAVILAGIGMTLYGTSVTRAKEAALTRTYFRCAKRSTSTTPTSRSIRRRSMRLVSEKYLREIKPDPFTLMVDSWQTTMSEPDAANPSAEPGIWNVKSGATGTGSDGRPYSEW